MRDEWIDNINWVKIHQVVGQKAGTKRDLESSDEETEVEAVDEVTVFRQIVLLMRPHETVGKALRRLGGGKAGLTSGSASQRLKAKRAKLKGEAGPADLLKAAQQKQDKENVEKLTGLADKLFQHGNLEIYQDTFEKLHFLINKAEEQDDALKTVVPAGMDDDDALDMFADNIDNKDMKDPGHKEDADPAARTASATTAQAPATPAKTGEF